MGKKELSLKDKFKEANSRHLSAFDTLLEKYQDGEIEDDEALAVPADQIGKDLLDSFDGDEDGDEFDIDFRKIFSTRPNKYGQEGQKKFTSTPRNDHVLRAAFKDQPPPRCIDSSPIVLLNKNNMANTAAAKKDAVAPPREPTKKTSSQSQPANIMSFFNFRKRPFEEIPISTDKGDEITSNDELVSISPTKKSKRDDQNRPPPSSQLQSLMARFSGQTPARKDSARPSLTMVTAANTPSVQPTTSSRSRPEVSDADNNDIEIINLEADEKKKKKKKKNIEKRSDVESDSEKGAKKDHKSRPPVPVPPPAARTSQSPPPPAADDDEPGDSQKSGVSKLMKDWASKNGGRCELQPQLLQLLAKNGRHKSTKTDEQRAEETKRARELALSFKPQKRVGGDPLLDALRRGAQLGVKKKSSS